MRRLKGSWRSMAFLLQRTTRFPFLLFLAVLTLIITAGSTVAVPYLTKPIVNDCILKGDIPGLIKLLCVLGLVYLVSVLASYCNSRILVRMAQRVSMSLRTEVFNKMQDLPMSFFDSHTHGELMSIYTNDIDTISNFISTSLANVLTGILTFCGILVMLLILNPLLALVSCVPFAVQYFIMKKSGGISRKGFVKQQAELADLNGFIEEMTEGQKVVKVFSHEGEAIEGFEKRNQALLDSSYQAQVYSGIIFPALGGIAEINNALTCTVGVIMTIAGIFDVGSLISFIQYMQKAGLQIAVLSGVVNIILAAVAGTERVMAVLDAPSEPDEGKVTLTDGKWSTGSPLAGRIVFEHAGFEYSEGHPILNDICFVAEPGKKIALVGSTGAGKTTIVNLLNRFYELSGGRVSYDGAELRDIKKDDLRRTLSMVLQDTHLFTDTVRENIRFGRLDATDAEVEQAARLANADFFIRHLPQGYDTLITSDGGSLSQGQRQLLAIARAAVANPAVLVLDEATSSIDTRTEKLIEAGMSRLMEGRTVFIIAHRLSTVRDCDTILVLEHGSIIERGTHEELLAAGGRYHQLYTGAAELD